MPGARVGSSFLFYEGDWEEKGLRENKESGNLEDCPMKKERRKYRNGQKKKSKDFLFFCFFV